MEKVYLKFRLEVLPGNWLLFQVLEQDKRSVIRDFSEFGVNLIDNIRSSRSPAIYQDDILLRGQYSQDDLKPCLTHYHKPEEQKKYFLKALSQFWKWEGFKDDFYKPNIEIFKPTTYLSVDGEICFLSELGLNAERFIFRVPSDVANAYDIFLDYQIWQRNEFTFMKVNYAADYFKIYSFSKKGIDDNIINSPFIYTTEIKFKGTLPEYDFNVCGVYHFKAEIDYINNQVLKFLNERLKPKQPELVDLGNNVYEVRG